MLGMLVVFEKIVCNLSIEDLIEEEENWFEIGLFRNQTVRRNEQA